MSSDPSTIGRYQVVSILGHGAMGMVYLAQDPLLKRRLAIKIVKDSGIEQRNALLRFQREAEISARLNDPNIITIYDVGEDPVAGPFLAMEYVEGTSLSVLIREHRMDAELAVRLLIQCAKALVAAEDAGVVHRDVKPENILVSADGRLKLMDFGIAKGDESKLTTDGMIVGTPSYSAPEVLKGADASAASDRYALAVTAFEMFSGGRMPHPGDTLGAILYHIVHEPPVMPEGMAPELARVFERAMDREPAQRYPDLRGFLTELARAARVSTTLLNETMTLPTSVPLHGSEGDEQMTMAIDQVSQMPNLGGASIQPMFDSGQKPVQAGGESGKLIPPRELFKEHVPAEPDSDHAMDAVPTLIPPKSMMKASTAAKASNPGSAGHSSGASAMRARPAAYPAAVPRTPIRDSSKDMPSSVSSWLIGAVVVILGGAVWAWQAANATRILTVTTQPPGAEVSIDGVRMGTTNPSFNREVKKNARILHLDLTFHVAKDVHLDPDQTNVNEQMELMQAYTRILTNPPGATVYVDGVSQGQTPIEALELPTKRAQAVKIVKKQYRDMTITLEPNRPLAGTLQLVPEVQ